jgi:hypothetical protein
MVRGRGNRANQRERNRTSDAELGFMRGGDAEKALGVSRAGLQFLIDSGELQPQSLPSNPNVRGYPLAQIEAIAVKLRAAR